MSGTFGTNWLDLSLSSNRHMRTYVQGFVDISGGNLIVRNNNLFVYGGDSSLNGRLLVSGDSSLNGNVTIRDTLYPTGGINLQNNLNMGGLINQSGTTVQGGIIYQPIVTSDVSAIINASNIYTSNMTQTGSNFIIGNTNTNVVIGVNGNPVTVSGPLNALYDTSMNGRLFVTKDVSFNSNLYVANNVGIAKTPAYPLDVSGQINANNGSNGIAFSSIVPSIPGAGNVTQSLIQLGVVNYGGKIGGGLVQNSGPILTLNTMNAGTTTEVMRILNTNVGIGVTAPAYTLDVSGTGRFTNDVALNGRLYLTGDASINGLIVGKGGGLVSTNTAMGVIALANNTTGTNNCAFGLNALQTNTTGVANCAFGQGALNSNTTAESNSAFGYSALTSNTTGIYNNAVGRAALLNNTTGNSNNAFGQAALRQNTTGSYNTAIGFFAGYNNSQAGCSNNTFLGSGADIDSSANAWTQSTAVGNNARITASNQITLGTATEKVYVPGDASFNGNVYIGKDLNVNGNLSVKQYSTNLTVYTVAYNNFTVAEDMSLNGRLYLTGDASMNGRLYVGGDVSMNGLIVGKGGGLVSTNTAMGVTALATNTTGSRNTAIGSTALSLNTTGNNNTAVGDRALNASTGNNNTAVGQGALAVNAQNSNTAVGQASLAANTSGSSNTAMGANSLATNTSGTSNTAIGQVALRYNTTASNNTALGGNAGVNNGASGASAQNNTYLGAYADIDSSANSWSNSTAIGYNSRITASNQITLGTATEKLFLPGGYINTADNTTLTLDGLTIPNYGLSWQQNTSFFASAPAGFISGYGGLRFQTQGVNRMNITAAGNIGIGTTTPLFALDVAGSTLIRNPTTYNTATAGWFNLGLWDCTASQNVGAHLKLKLLGNQSYDLGTLSAIPSTCGGETTIYATNLNNLTNAATNANITGSWTHFGGYLILSNVKFVSNSSSRYQYYVYAYVNTYTQHSINAETTMGTTFTPSFLSTTDPGSNSATVYVATNPSVTVAGNIGIGTTNPAYTLDVTGSGRFTNGLGVTGGLNVYDGTTSSLSLYTGFNLYSINGNFMGITVPTNAFIGFNVGATNEALTIRSSTILTAAGVNVGIGTTTPIATLDISGTASLSTGSASNTYKNLYGKAPPTTTYLSSVTPNTTNATSTSWINNNITWTSSQSSAASEINGNTYYPYNSNITSGNIWTSSSNYSTASPYNSTTGASTYIISIGTVIGEWTQIQPSIPLTIYSYQVASGSNVLRSPYKFYIVGSNDGSTWYPIQYVVTPIGTNPYATTYSYPSTNPTILANNQYAATTYGASTITTTTYTDYTTQPYSYFRMITTNIYGGGTQTWVDVAEWNITFSVPTVTGPSRSLLYMDPLNINQLDVSGSLGLINSSPSVTATVTPVSSAATGLTWANNNLTWVSSSSSVFSTAYSWIAFSTNTTSSNVPWTSGTATYTGTGGAYVGTTYGTIIQGINSGANVYGEWLQIKSSVPVIMDRYNFASQNGTAEYQGRLPKVYYICGSNDGSTWYPIQYVTFTSAPVASSTSTASQSTATYTINSTTTVQTQNASTSVYCYSTSLNSYTYFRLVVTSAIYTSTLTGASAFTGSGYLSLFWYPYFTTTTVTTKSSVSMALDNGTPNQLNIGGSLSFLSPLANVMTNNIFPHYSRYATNATQSIANGSETLVIYHNSAYTSPYTGITYMSSGTGITGAFRNTSGGSLLVMVNACIGYSGSQSTASFGCALKISNNTSPAANTDYSYINMTQSAGPSTTARAAVSASAIYVLPSNYYIGAFAYQDSGGARNTNHDSGLATTIQLTVLGAA